MTLGTRQSLDREHLDIADATAAVLRHRSDGGCLEAALKRLCTVVCAHFRSEREAMEAIAYSMIAQHLAEHTLVEDALTRAAKALLSGKPEADLDFALGLLLAHQTGADRTLFAHLDERKERDPPVPTLPMQLDHLCGSQHTIGQVGGSTSGMTKRLTSSMASASDASVSVS